MKICSTTNTQVIGDFVEFRCPGCFEEWIVRSHKARATSKTYTCKKCGFVGP
ncbi:MAG TPA: hypothetical protein HA237_02365 [Candidatus Diapherotrites archaeon]|nr:hypothetical protein [Candidatus Diapherotrites archaeon]